MNEELIKIRCPFERTREGVRYICQQLVVRVYAGSRGQAYCTRCKRTFDFDVSSAGFTVEDHYSHAA